MDDNEIIVNTGKKIYAIRNERSITRRSCTGCRLDIQSIESLEAGKLDPLMAFLINVINAPGYTLPEFFKEFDH